MKKITPVVIVFLIIILGGGLYFLLKDKIYSPQKSEENREIQEVQGIKEIREFQESSEGALPGLNELSKEETKKEEIKEGIIVAIAIKNFQFDPPSLNIKTGTTVRWVNQDWAPHNIESDNFKSNILKINDKFEYQFKMAGVYDYLCGLHPSMRGRIIVQEK